MDGRDIHSTIRLSAEERRMTRQHAEERLANQPKTSSAEQEALLPKNIQSLLHELQVRQIELEMQNDELRRISDELDTAQARYFDFFDMAPVGYCLLSEQGIIKHANLTTATILQTARQGLLGQSFTEFVSPHDQDALYLFRRTLLATRNPQSCELQLTRSDATRFWVSLDGIAVQEHDGSTALRLVMNDITERKQADEELRIAAVAFEAQVAIVVMDSRRLVLRVNSAFTRITGYKKNDVLGQKLDMLRSKREVESSYEEFWREAINDKGTRVTHWLRHQNGDDFFARCTITMIQDNHGETTHYVFIFSDQTLDMVRKQQRLQDEASHRDALVREVHHRIKNNLQGIGGLLLQFASQKPEIADQMKLVAGHLNGISVIHGLQGLHEKSRVRLCELTREIAQSTSVLWQVVISVDIPHDWVFRVVAEKEAVSVALVINEVIVNAVKHGGKALGHVSVTLMQGQGVAGVDLSVINAGYLCKKKDLPTEHPHGLQLIESLRPREGLTVTMTQSGDQVQTLLRFTAPVLTIDPEG